ncbi:MAG: zinc-ribbon domain-containing protein [Eggerthellaceae bacterium]|jgi:uncharacterized Zn finger protein (UPF0148 family)
MTQGGFDAPAAGQEKSAPADADLTLLREHLHELDAKRTRLAAELGALVYQETMNDPAARRGREALYTGISAVDRQRNQVEDALARLLKGPQSDISFNYCPRCGTPVASGNQYCIQCGTEFASWHQPEPRPQENEADLEELDLDEPDMDASVLRADQPDVEASAAETEDAAASETPAAFSSDAAELAASHELLDPGKTELIPAAAIEAVLTKQAGEPTKPSVAPVRESVAGFEADATVKLPEDVDDAPDYNDADATRVMPAIPDSYKPETEQRRYRSF